MTCVRKLQMICVSTYLGALGESTLLAGFHQREPVAKHVEKVFLCYGILALALVKLEDVGFGNTGR